MITRPITRSIVRSITHPIWSYAEQIINYVQFFTSDSQLFLALTGEEFHVREN